MGTKMQNNKIEELPENEFISLEQKIMDKGTNLSSKYFDTILIKYPDSEFVVSMKIIFLCYENNLIEAERTLEKNKNERFGTYLLNAKGFVDHFRGNFDSSLAYYLRSIDADFNKKNFWVRANLAYMYEDVKNYDLAEYWYNNIINSYPKYKEPYFHYANMLINLNELSKAEDILNKIDNYDLPRVLQLKSEIELSRNNLLKAYDLIKQSLNLNKNDLDANVSFLGVLFYLQKFNETEEELNFIKKIYPDNTDIKYYEGCYFYDTKKYSDAKRILLNIIKITEINSRPEYYNVLGLTLIKLKEFKDGYNYITKAITIFGNNFLFDAQIIIFSYLLKNKNAETLKSEYEEKYSEREIKFLYEKLNENGISTK